MTLYHFSNKIFDKFDTSFLGHETMDRGCDNDDTMTISNFGFCFVEENSTDNLKDFFSADFAAYVATCEVDCRENFDSTWDDFVEWIGRDGAENVRAQLQDDGIEYLRLWNGSFNEIIVLDSASVEITLWEKV